MNLYAYGYRHYDPAIARWTTMDPLLNDLKFSFDDNGVDEDDEDDVYQALVTKLETGNGIFNTDNLNPYGYGYNNPISFDDPDGRCPICLLVVAALLVSQSAEAPTGNYKMDTQSRNATAGNNTLIPGLIAGGATGNIVTNAYKANSIRRTIENAKDSKGGATVVKKEPIPKSPTGKGSVPPNQRDPKRVMTKSEKAEMLKENKGKCEGCDKKITIDEAKGHHIKRHADGGKTTKENTAILCETCHKEVHSKPK